MARTGYGGRGSEPTFYRKVILYAPRGRRRIAWETPAVTFDELSADDYLDTADLEVYFDCSQRTIYRWINELGLVPDDQIGNSLYFEKRTVVRWEKQHRPKRGRPFD
jgi:hypothetical protein